MNRNVNEKEIIKGLKFLEIKINGRRRAISISKIKKISLIIKNWVLKGNRALDDGLNPHLNGDIFSLFKLVFLEIIKLIKNKMEDKINKKMMNQIIFMIIYINLFKCFNWKLNVIIFILYKYISIN